MIPSKVEPMIKKYGKSPVIDIEEVAPANFTLKDLKLKFGACVIIKDLEDKLILIRQSRSRPELDKEEWSFVCGRPEKGESLEETAIREVQEEIDCLVRITGIHHIGNHYALIMGKKCSLYYGIAFFAELISGTPRVNSNEVCDVAVFSRLPINFARRYRKYYPDLI